MNEKLTEWLESQDFYELCQQYRHAKDYPRHDGISSVVEAFEELKRQIRDAALRQPAGFEAGRDAAQSTDQGESAAVGDVASVASGLRVGTPFDSASRPCTDQQSDSHPTEQDGQAEQNAAQHGSTNATRCAIVAQSNEDNRSSAVAAPQSEQEADAWMLKCRKPGEQSIFLDLDEDTNQHWPVDQWTAIEKFRLYLHPARREAPIDMVLYCPKCGSQHIDAPDARTVDWMNPPHKSHLCHGCGHVWRPSDTPTNGVKATASGKDADTRPSARREDVPNKNVESIYAEARRCINIFCVGYGLTPPTEEMLQCHVQELLKAMLAAGRQS